MANIKITDLDSYSDPSSTDVLPIVDVTNDETKRVSIADLMENAGVGTEELPGIAFDGDPNTGIYRPDPDQLAISTAGVQRLLVNAGGAVTIPGSLTVEGDATFEGATTFIDSTTLQVEDKNIELGKVGTPSDTTANGGGITLLGTTNHTITWTNSTDSWDFSEHVDLDTGKEYRIGGTSVLTATTLGSGVTDSSLTSVGTITSGTWNGTPIATDFIADDAVTGDKLANTAVTAGSYTAADITVDAQGRITSAASGTISTAEIADDAVTADKLANTAVTAGSYTAADITVDAQGRITSAASGTISTAEIADDAVTAAKLANTAVTAGSYTAADITVDAQGRITAASSGTISTAEIADDAVTAAKLANTAVTAGSYTNADITVDAQGRITAAAAGTISTAEIENSAVTSAKIATSAVTTAKIANDAVTADKLADTAVTAGSYTIADITVDAQGRITAASSGEIATAQIADNAVTTAKIANSAVTSAKIADGAILNADVNASAAIAGTKISPNFGSQNIVTTGTATISGDLAVDTDTLFADASEDRVGVNTSTPAVSLDVNGTDAVALPHGTEAERPSDGGTPANLTGYIRFNSDISQFEGHNGTAWSSVGGGATGGGSDQWAIEHDNSVTTDYTITANRNVISAGPITIDSGATVTVGSSSNWAIV